MQFAVWAKLNDPEPKKFQQFLISFNRYFFQARQKNRRGDLKGERSERDYAQLKA